MSIINDNTDIRDVSGLTSTDKEAINNFLLGAVYCWCKNCSGMWFGVKELMGGENYYWNNTPLIALYNKHINSGKESDEAVEAAGRDAGWLLKKLVNDMLRQFETKKDGLSRVYKWDGDTSFDTQKRGK